MKKIIAKINLKDNVICMSCGVIVMVVAMIFIIGLTAHTNPITCTQIENVTNVEQDCGNFTATVLESNDYEIAVLLTTETAGEISVGYAGGGCDKYNFTEPSSAIVFIELQRATCDWIYITKGNATITLPV